MRVFLVVPFLLMAGASAHAQSFSFNVGGQPVLVDIRGPCAECITVVVPGYVQYGRRHYYDYEVPYGERRPSRLPRAAQSQKRKPQVAMVRDPLPARSSPNRHATPPAIDVTPTPAAPTAIQPKPEITRALPATPPAAPPHVNELPATPPAAAVPATEPVASPVVAAAPAAVLPPSPAPEAVAPTPPVTTAPVTPEIAAAPPVPAATPVPAARPAPEKKPAVMAALPPAKQDVEQRAKPSATSPIGVWSSSEGQMRVEPCGKNLCSYAVGGPKAGAMVLKQMRQTGVNHWSGQVTDIRSGQTYSAHMSLRGTNGLNIQGCALGGMVCGGRTLTRVR